MTSSFVRSLRANSSSSSACTRSRRWSASSRSRVVAPRRARTAGDTAGQASRRPHRPRIVPSARTSTMRELSPRSGLQPAVRDRADAHAHQPAHRMADRVAHPAHLAVASFVDRDAQQVRRRQRDLRRRGDAVLERDALAEHAHRRGRGSSRDLGQVLLLDPERRMGEPMREVAVVREEQQPLGVGVEPTDREHPRLGGHEVGDDRPSLRVGERRHHASRLVQQVVDETRVGPRAARRRPRCDRPRRRPGDRGPRPRR